MIRLPARGRTPVGWLCWSWQDPTRPRLSGASCAEELYVGSIHSMHTSALALPACLTRYMCFPRYLQSAQAMAAQGFCDRGT